MRMRLRAAGAAAVVCSLSGSAFAQPPSPQASTSLAAVERGGGEWIEFASREDRFTCNFPSHPSVSQTTWTSECGAVLPARVYSAAQGQSRFSMMVADYREIYLHGAPPPPANSRGGQGGFGRINAPSAPAAQDGPATPPGGALRS